MSTNNQPVNNQPVMWITNLWTCLIGIRAARRNWVKDWSVKLQIRPNSDHAFWMISPCPCAHVQHRRTPLRRAVLSKREVCSGLACGRRRGYDATLRLVRDTELWNFARRLFGGILFLSVVIKKRTIEHENSVSQRSLHSLTVLIDFDNRRDLTYLYVTYRHDTFVRFSRSDPLKRLERLFKYSCREASIEYSKLHCERTSLLEASLRAYS